MLRFLRPRAAFLEDGETPVDDLAFLARHRGTLKRLSVVGDEPVDVAEINQLKALERLDIDAPGGAKDVLRLRNLPNLLELSVTLRGEGESALRIDWAGGSALESLWLAGPDENDIDSLQYLTRLVDLRLEAPPRIPAAVGRELVILDISAGEVEWPEQILGLDSLKDLTISESATLTDLNAFRYAPPLDDLELSDLPNLRSLAGVRLADGAAVLISDCPNLADLGGIDRSRLDGNVTGSPLVGFP